MEAPRHEWQHELEMYVTALPESYRVAVTLFYYEDLSYAEIAELLNQPLGAVKGRLSRARRLLQELLMTQEHALHDALHPAGEQTEAASRELLVATLHDPAWEVRAAAIWTLGSWGERAPGEALLNALSHEDGSVRAAVLRTLHKIGGHISREPALRLLHDADWQVREAATLTLEEIGEQAQGSLELLLASIDAFSLRGRYERP